MLDARLALTHSNIFRHLTPETVELPHSANASAPLFRTAREIEQQRLATKRGQ